MTWERVGGGARYQGRWGAREMVTIFTVTYVRAYIRTNGCYGAHIATHRLPCHSHINTQVAMVQPQQHTRVAMGIA